METSHMNVDEISLGELEDGELPDEQDNNPGFVTVTDAERKLLRAKRFGISGDHPRQKCEDSDTLKMHKRMGVHSNTRIEALHLHNTLNLTTDDIVIYFNEIPPLSIEWISKSSCNATWLDPETCAKALKKYSIRIIGQTSDDDSVSEDEAVHINDIRTALPPGIWRKGVRYSLAPNLILRYATFLDKRSEKNDFVRNDFIFADEGDEREKNTKQVISSNPWSDIAWKWGKNEQKLAAAKQQIPEIKERITDAREILSKRLTKNYNQSDSDHEFEDNVLVGKMRADQEEEYSHKKKFPPRYQQIDLRNKIERKRKYIELPRKYNEIDDALMSAKRLLRTEKKQFSSSESESNEDSDSSSDRRSHRHHRHHKSSRRKDKHKCKIHHSKSKTKSKFFVPSPLRIEIDNDVYFEVKDEPEDD